MMRKKMPVLSALLGAAALAVASGWSTPRALASGTASNGEFIIRCPMTGEVQQLDPLEDPGKQVASGHEHMFFGNSLNGAGVQSSTTYTGLNRAANATTTGTTCQDSKDTAAYWAPESFMPGGNAYDPTTPAAVSWYLPGCTFNGGTGINYSCGTDTNHDIYIRAYYTTTQAPAVRQLPPGTVMISGTPDATGPSGATQVTAQTAVYWTCGANTVNRVVEQTPESTWPYDCSPWSGKMPPSEQGLDEIIRFPSCWDGQSSFHSPNGSGPPGTSGMVPYYLPAPATIGGVTYSSPGDLNFPDPATGKCDTAPWTTAVPHLSIRIHYQLQTVRAPNSPVVGPSSCADNITGVTCTPEAPGPAGAPSNIALQLSSTAAGGDPGGWWTEHADYWQAWQQGLAAGPGGVVSPEPGTGTLNSLTYYCLAQHQTCSFITNANYPPPPS
jgi:Domain of unknown function (DUF1996)